MRCHLRMRFILAVGLLSLAAAKAAENDTLPLTLPADPQEGKVRAVQDRVYNATQAQARYLLTKIHPWSADSKLLLLTDSKSGEHWIRPNAGTVEGLAFLVRFGPYDERAVGVPRERLLRETVLPMLRYLTTTHLTGTRPTSDGKRWGDAWQSAHWAQMVGRAAWWLGPDLPADLRQAVQRLVAHEADRIARTQPPHQIKFDTKAEENAWNSQILSVAMLLLPHDPRRPQWETAFQKWVLSSFLRPADEQSQTVVDGRTVAAQFTGANIYDDFTLENHGFVHPDYMTTFSLSLGCVLDYALTGRRPPEALQYNVTGIYENLKWFVLPDGGYVYPNGQDWELFRNPAWLGKNVLMAVVAADPDAWSLALRTLDALERMQARSATGAIFYEGEYFFPSTQSDVLRSLAHAWLVLQTARKVPDKPQPRLGVRRLDAAQIILHRTPTAVHTVSWGAKIMAQCVAYRLDRLVSPHQRSGIGHVQLKGGKGPARTKLTAVQVADRPDGFTADLTVVHGEKIRAELRFQSAADGTWTMHEKLVALADVTTTEIATGLIGILNNPHWIYERGVRRVRMDREEVSIPAKSDRWQVNACKEITVDDVLQIRCAQPLTMGYHGARDYDRGRMTDELYLNYRPGEHRWPAGATISEFEVTIRTVGAETPATVRPDKTGDRTAPRRSTILERRQGSERG